MPTSLEIIKTNDGSDTVLDSRLDITYHSTHGALTESSHVFIKNGLAYLPKQGLTCLRILELGLGTGLNALLTYQFARRESISIDYTALEPFPLPEEITSRLNYPQITGIANASEVFSSLHRSPVEFEQRISDGFVFRCSRSPIQEWSSQQPYDIVFYDAFGPAAAPELWDIPVLSHVRGMLRPNAVLVTFCAQGQFKRNLTALGFEVDSIPGPPGKREMVRATLRAQGPS